MKHRAGYQITVPTGALGELIDAVHELAVGPPAPTWRTGNVTYLGRPCVRDRPVPATDRCGHAVAAIALTQRNCPTVDVVFAITEAVAYAEFLCRSGHDAKSPDLVRLRGLVSTTAAALTARGIPATADPIADR
ncbi:hypothetical protein [Nocardia alba]|uniref:Uncharacterized protein n=1 Tax=Nocardia alba TaxID=225051 RepID=A0A4R1FV23_9NOCA|nr:hypothetical protein [Nocardia alba]TCJ97694.1 hypothetical protein DFR71_3742 [Nocardia alba]